MRKTTTTMTMTLTLIAAVTAVTMIGKPTHADVTDEQVRDAIRKGVQALYDSQEAWGHWDEQKDPRQANNADHRGKQYGGTTALACYALLTAGEEWQQNPKLQKPMEWLAQMNPEMDGTYAVGLRAHVWPKLPDKFLDELQEDAYLLIEGINAKGGYRYTLGDAGIDNSCTQYGALGAWECAKRGVPIPNSYWQKLEKHFVEGQLPDGGWGYTDDRDASNLTMTSAGLAIMYVTLDYLHSNDFMRPGATDRHPVYSRIQKGLDAFEKHFSVTTSGYAAVGIERVGLASGRKFFKGKDWYQEIASSYVSKMGNNGIGGGQRSVVETSFALIFLSRGRVPVFANKLEIEGHHWDNRPRDLANVTKWASDEFEIPLNWQIVGIDTDPELWLDSSVLYFASHEPLNLDDAQLAKIKRYLDLGGTLIVNPDDSNRRFMQSVRDTFEKIYPYKFKQVDAQDDLYNIVYQLRNENVETLNNGVRHMVIMMGKDVGGIYQSNAQRDPAPWYTMANIFQYAIEKSQPRARLEKHVETRDGRASRTIHIARAQYNGNWNPEPLTWDRTDVSAANEGKANLRTHEIDLANIAGQDVSLVHVTGTEAVEFTPDQIEAIRKFVKDDGGVILFESVGGKPAFSSSAMQMLREAFPGADQLPRRLGVTDGLISGDAAPGAYDVSKVDYRLYYKQRLGASTRPGLQAIFVDGKPRIIVSAEDLSVGALGQPVWGVFGYDTESARKILTNVALFAAQEKPANGEIEADEQPDPEEVAAE